MTYETDVHIGKVHCIDLETDGDDWWWPRTLTIDFEDGDPVIFYNTYNQKLSTNDKGSPDLLFSAISDQSSPLPYLRPTL